MSKIDVPTYDNLMNPVIQALKDLGGSGTIEEINNKAAEISGLSEYQLEIPHNPEKGGQTEVGYRLAWARTYLKKYGTIENSARGVWTLTAEGRKIDHLDTEQVKLTIRNQFRKPGKSEKNANVKISPADNDSALAENRLAETESQEFSRILGTPYLIQSSFPNCLV